MSFAKEVFYGARAMEVYFDGFNLKEIHYEVFFFLSICELIKGILGAKK